MKTLKVYISIGTLALAFICLSFKPLTCPVANKNVSQADTVHYADGIYEGKSQDGYAGMEPFWGIVRMKVEKELLPRSIS